jgi:hypothetical protein
MAMNKSILNEILKRGGITADLFVSNTKASEEYVNVIFIQEDGFEWQGYIPYQYRRTGLAIETEEALAEYLFSIKPYFVKKEMEKWAEEQKKFWATEKSGAEVTFPFFKAMCSFKWTKKFPQNNNPQRRIQDIKELGYTISTRFIGRTTERLLLPIPRAEEMSYETFSPQFKYRVIKLLKGVNAFEAKPANNPKSLIPDHKFSEIRWDENTKSDNSMEMTDDEIIEKFQLLDNQRNLQKREICRKCFQENKRGEIYGIKFYSPGSGEWDKSIPKKGKKAEKGCVGCPWYDIQKWRDELNTSVKEK